MTSEINPRDRLPGDVVREIGGNVWIHHPGRQESGTNLAAKRRMALLSVEQRYEMQRENDRAADVWTDPKRVITRRADQSILVDGKPIGGR
jgi:hypothetical protein